MKKKLRPIVLAGGSGNRLWPLSTKSNPKQFLPLINGSSPLDLTFTRLNNSNLFKKPIVVTSEKYLQKVNESAINLSIQLKSVILEPEPKNTYPAIVSAVSLALKSNPEELFIVIPSDHYFDEKEGFYKSCKVAIKTQEQKNLTLFGVKPQYPSSEFGYIRKKKRASSITVDSFIEKPSLKKAKVLYKDKNVFWNAGIFIFKGNWFIKMGKSINKTLVNNIQKSVDLGSHKGESFYLQKTAFSKVTSRSIDKAFVEKCSKINMVNLDAGWSDMGSWTTLSALHKDPLNSISLKAFQNQTKINKPWGFYQVLMENNSSKVKIITVLPKQKLSLQKHKYRSETWHIIQGKAKATRGPDKFTLELGDSIVIDKNQTHSVENLEQIPLEILEIQTGSYLGEDDIVRYEDRYGRIDLH